MYTDPDGKKHESYGAYCNLEDLDPDLKMLFLWRGNRTPQNKLEEEMLEELEDMKRRGVGIELNFN